MNHRFMILCLVACIFVGMSACGPTSEATPSGDAASLLQDARNALSAGNPDLAVSKAQQALKLNKSAEGYFLLGNAYARKEQYGQAEAQYLEALKLNDKDADVRTNLGVVYYRQGKLQEAEKAFRAAVALQPNDAEIRYNLGGVLVALGRPDEAVNEFLKAKELNPSLAEAYLGLGTVYKAQGKNAQAISALQEYLKLSQDPTWREQATQMLRELGGKP